MSAVIAVDRLTRLRRAARDRRVAFHIDAGEVFGFLGPNGAGKSTTIRLLLGLYTRRRDGPGSSAWTPRRRLAIHLRVGYLPGELALYPRLTGGQHVDRSARARGMPDPASSTRSWSASTSSWTVRSNSSRRATARRSASSSPSCTGRSCSSSTSRPLGLDPLLQHEFQGLLRETVDEGRTVFLSSHELDEVQRLVDRLAIIKDGKLVVTDTVERLRHPRRARSISVRARSIRGFAEIAACRSSTPARGHLAGPFARRAGGAPARGRPSSTQST